MPNGAEGDCGMKWYSFSMVITDVTSKFTKIKTSDYHAHGQYKIIDQGKEPTAGYTDDASLVNGQLLPILIFGDHTRVLKYADTPVALGADGAKALWVNPDLANARYVYYYLRTVQIKEAGYSRHFKFLKEVEIPIPFNDGAPDLDAQIRIAHLLGKVEGLIAQRKQHLQQLDDLLKSVFLEMFGDPVRNEKGWEPATSSIYADMVTVGVVVKPASHYVERGVVALRSLNIKPNRIDLSDLVYFSQHSSDGILSKSRLQTNDVVIVRTGKTGTAAVVPAELHGANCIDLIVVRPKHQKLNPNYLTCLLNSERGMALVSSLEVGGIQKHFNVGALNKIAFPLPPIDLQNQFATIVGKVEALKSRYQESLTDLESVYGALSQQAFRGELDLSRVPLPEDTVNQAAKVEELAVIDNNEASILENFRDYPLSDPKTRRRFIERAFGGFLMLTKEGSELSMKDFWARLGWDGIDLVQEGDLPFNAKDYDLVKKLVFDAIARGEIVQTRNQIDIGDKMDFGNEVVLKKAL